MQEGKETCLQKRSPRTNSTVCPFVAVYLYCKRANVFASYKIEALDASGVVQDSAKSGPRAFGDSAWGWSDFLNREEAAQSGLLAGDSLRLRVTVTLAG